MFGVGKGSSLPNPGGGLDTLMNSPLMQTLQGKNQPPEMAGNTAQIDPWALLQGNHDYWRQQGQFPGKPSTLADLDFKGPAAPTIQPRPRSANQQADLVNIDELIRRRLYGSGR